MMRTITIGNIIPNLLAILGLLLLAILGLLLLAILGLLPLAYSDSYMIVTVIVVAMNRSAVAIEQRCYDTLCCR